MIILIQIQRGGAGWRKAGSLTVCLKECGTETAGGAGREAKGQHEDQYNYIKEWNDWFDGYGAQIRSSIKLRLLPGHRRSGGI